MKPVFEIIPEAIFFQQTNLICEISADGFSYIFENDIDKKFHGLSVFYFTDEAEPTEQLKEIFDQQPLLSKKYRKVFVSYTGTESALLPEELYRQNENEIVIDTLFGDLNKGTIATDLIADKKIYNVYRMPPGIHKAIVDHFPLAAFSHHYSLLIKNISAGDILKVIFYRDTFIAVLIKDELQIIHTYCYRSGVDAVYHLLNICRQFKRENVSLELGGMIEIDSDLYKEIAHYFKNITLAQLPAEYEYAERLKELQPHYFSHLFSVALCV